MSCSFSRNDFALCAFPLDMCYFLREAEPESKLIDSSLSSVFISLVTVSSMALNIDEGESVMT